MVAEGSAPWAVVVTTTRAAEDQAEEAPAVATPAAAAIRAYPMVAVLVGAVLGEVGGFAGWDLPSIAFREAPPNLHRHFPAHGVEQERQNGERSSE